MLWKEYLPLHGDPDIVQYLVATVVQEHSDDGERDDIFAELQHDLVDWRNLVEIPEHVDRHPLLLLGYCEFLAIGRRRLITLAFLRGGRLVVEGGLLLVALLEHAAAKLLVDQQPHRRATLGLVSRLHLLH